MKVKEEEKATIGLVYSIMWMLTLVPYVLMVDWALDVHHSNMAVIVFQVYLLTFMFTVFMWYLTKMTFFAIVVSVKTIIQILNNK